MKTISNLLIISLCIVSLSSCSKEGPAGPVGPSGPAGSAGQAGTSANVTQYSFGPMDFSTNARQELLVATTLDTMNRSAWFAYIIHSNGAAYAVPGWGLEGFTSYRYAFAFNSSTNKVVNTIAVVAGPGEAYQSAKVIRIYANSTGAGGRNALTLPDIDFTDYEKVRQYYNLPE